LTLRNWHRPPAQRSKRRLLFTPKPIPMAMGSCRFLSSLLHPQQSERHRCQNPLLPSVNRLVKATRHLHPPNNKRETRCPNSLFIRAGNRQLRSNKAGNSHPRSNKPGNTLLCNNKAGHSLSNLWFSPRSAQACTVEVAASVWMRIGASVRSAVNKTLAIEIKVRTTRPRSAGIRQSTRWARPRLLRPECQRLHARPAWCCRRWKSRLYRGVFHPPTRFQ